MLIVPTILSHVGKGHILSIIRDSKTLSSSRLSRPNIYTIRSTVRLSLLKAERINDKWTQRSQFSIDRSRFTVGNWSSPVSCIVNLMIKEIELVGWRVSYVFPILKLKVDILVDLGIWRIELIESLYKSTSSFKRAKARNLRRQHIGCNSIRSAKRRT